MEGSEYHRESSFDSFVAPEMLVSLSDDSFSRTPRGRINRSKAARNASVLNEDTNCRCGASLLKHTNTHK